MWINVSPVKATVSSSGSTGPHARVADRAAGPSSRRISGLPSAPLSTEPSSASATVETAKATEVATSKDGARMTASV